MNVNSPIPFPVNGYAGSENFCDREDELKLISGYLKGKIPVVIIGIRRLGKSGLIQHLFQKTRYKGVYVDLQKTSSLEGLTNALADGIGEAFPEAKYKQVWDVLKSFRPSITFDPISGSPQFSFSVQKPEQIQQTLQGLLRIVSARKEKVVIAFDEFQEIKKYPEKNVEGILRAEMQKHSGLNYLFSGSQTNMLNAMFLEGEKPFFANTAKLYLQKIDSGVYADFIKNQFKKHGKRIDIALISEILEWTDVHTFYTQFFCNQLFIYSDKHVSEANMNWVKGYILQTAKNDYFQLNALLSKGQKQVIIAVAKEEMFFNPSANSHKQTYNLGTSRGIIKNLEVLVEKQLINLFHADNGEPYYKLANIFVMRYIQQYLNN